MAESIGNRKKLKSDSSSRSSNAISWQSWADKYSLPPGTGDFIFSILKIPITLYRPVIWIIRLQILLFQELDSNNGNSDFVMSFVMLHDIIIGHVSRFIVSCYFIFMVFSFWA